MRQEYLRKGIEALNNFYNMRIDEEIVTYPSRSFEKRLIESLPHDVRSVVKDRQRFLSSRKELKFSKFGDELRYLILRNILVTNYLLRDDVYSGNTPYSALDMFKSGILKISSDFPESKNENLANFISNHGSLIFKTKNSMAKNYAEIRDIVTWIEQELKKVILAIFNVQEKTIDRQFRDNSFLQIAPVSPREQNADHQSDLHMDTFFPALKWWYFPKEVAEKNGPFQYLLSSASPRIELYEFLKHALSSTANLEKLGIESLKSHEEGSLRGDVEQSEKLFNSKVTPITCSAGTLIIGNVMGLHARGFSKVPENRLALHGSFRSTIHDQYSLRNFFRGFIQ